ncbi:MAG: hypoxanthine phosphoribosyltransferase [Gemmatimonadota bacterium]
MSIDAEQIVTAAGQRLARVVYSEGEIADRVREMGREITAHYPADEDLLVLGLLKGSFIFVADLVRQIDRPLHIDFLVAASYGAAKVSSGQLDLLYDPRATFRDRHVIVVEDIIDSGNTLRRLVPALQARGPRSLEVCALLHKRLVEMPVAPRWVGFDAPSDFLVGYGLDYSEDFRHLPFIGSLEERP